jgi:hypothetical protein
MKKKLSFQILEKFLNFFFLKSEISKKLSEIMFFYDSENAKSQVIHFIFILLLF